jgi:hypothetical protein
MLQGKVKSVISVSMKRKAGDEYAFKDPLRKNVLERHEYAAGQVIVAFSTY